MRRPRRRKGLLVISRPIRRAPLALTLLLTLTLRLTLAMVLTLTLTLAVVQALTLMLALAPRLALTLTRKGARLRWRR